VDRRGDTALLQECAQRFAALGPGDEQVVHVIAGVRRERR
jgi:hypothetical protein